MKETMKENSYLYEITQKMYAKVLSKQDEITYNAIKQYCEEHNIIPMIIEEERLKEVLTLGMAELEKRNKS